MMGSEWTGVWAAACDPLSDPASWLQETGRICAAGSKDRHGHLCKDVQQQIGHAERCPYALVALSTLGNLMARGQEVAVICRTGQGANKR